VPRFAGGQGVAKVAQDLAAGDIAREHDERDAPSWLRAATGEVGVAEIAGVIPRAEVGTFEQASSQAKSGFNYVATELLVPAVSDLPIYVRFC
jgi:hypothetical protein